MAHYKFSPAGLVLAEAGVSQAEVATALGVTAPAVSNYMTGARRAPSSLFDVVRDLAGDEAVDRLTQLLHSSDGRYSDG